MIRLHINPVNCNIVQWQTVLTMTTMEFHLASLLCVLLGLGLVPVYCDPIRELEINVTSCMDGRSYIDRGETCYVHCSVSGLGENEYFGIEKIRASYYGAIYTQRFSPHQENEFWNSKDGLRTSLPKERYAASSTPFQINLTFTDSHPNDHGTFRCWIKTDLGQPLKYSEEYEINILDPIIHQSWGLSDGEGNLIETFKNNIEVDIRRNETNKLYLRVNMTDVLVSIPYQDINIIYETYNQFIRTKFETNDEWRGGFFNSTGLLSEFTSTVNYFNYTDSLLADRGKPAMTTEFSYSANDGISRHESVLFLNLLYEPFFTTVPNHYCNISSVQASIGSRIKFDCPVAANPELTYLGLKLPGRDALITNSNTDDSTQIDLTETETTWLYTISVTFANVDATVFGENTLTVRNSEGEAIITFNVNEKDDDSSGISISFSTYLIISLLTMGYCMTGQ